MPRDLVLRLVAPMLRDAVMLVERGIAAPAAVDLAMRLGARHPQGPLERLAALAPGDRRVVLGDHGEPAWLGRAEPEEAPTSAPPPAAGTLVGVVGSGFMASGIAYAAAVAGHDVVVGCRSDAAGCGSLARIARDLDGAVARGRLTGEQRDAALSRVRAETRDAALGEALLVVEAVSEDLAVKQAVFERLDVAAPAGTLLASSTSSLRIADVAARARRPDRVIGLHFFSPVPAMKLVEVVGTDAVPEDRLERAAAWVRGLGKVPVRCADRNGFIVNRLLIPFLNDAVRAHDDGVASIAEIDAAMTAEAAQPMGPFALLDLIGLDVSLAAQRTMYEAERDERLRPAAGLLALVAAGRLGRKSGRGFHDHAAPVAAAPG